MLKTWSFKLFILVIERNLLEKKKITCMFYVHSIKTNLFNYTMLF